MRRNKLVKEKEKKCEKRKRQEKGKMSNALRSLGRIHSQNVKQATDMSSYAEYMQFCK